MPAKPVSLSLILFLLSGSMFFTPASGKAEEPVNQPGYEKNITFIYDNKRVETFSKVDGDVLVWKHRSGRKYSRSASFFVPILRWKTSRSKGIRNIQGNPDKLWPLKPGNSVRYSLVTNSTVRHKNEKWADVKSRRFVQFWKCEVRDSIPVEVPAGTFNTYPIICTKFSTYSMKLLQKQTWYYAPAVGHYIKKDNLSYLTGRHSTMSLVATLSGKKANPKRIKAILKTLE